MTYTQFLNFVLFGQNLHVLLDRKYGVIRDPIPLPVWTSFAKDPDVRSYEDELASVAMASRREAFSDSDPIATRLLTHVRCTRADPPISLHML